VPEALTVHRFLVRVGEFGGYAVLETDDLAEVQKLTTTFAVFRFRLEPVMDVMEAVAAEVEGIAWRESNAPS
jgi:muconolactone delta-isomerase